jgi:predicted dehydrogenase
LLFKRTTLTTLKVFARDLLLDPTTRGVTDIQHEIAAASTQDSAARAQTFLDDLHAPSSAKAYGNYAALLDDAAVDIVYIGTPHSHHYQHARAALEAGKHVLCEKPMTVNAAQTAILVELARRKGLFLMEAVWTRFMPLVQEVTKMVQDGKLGTVWRVFADLSGYHDLDGGAWDGTRLVEMDLAGGALLDRAYFLTPYP